MNKTLAGYVLLFVILIAIAVAWDVFRWHTFQDVTNSDISYLKWKFFIDDTRR